MKRYDLMKHMLLYFVFSFIVIYIFYRSLIMAGLCGCIAIFVSLIKHYKGKGIKREDELLSFKELLNGIYSALLSGKSLRNSLEQGISEIENLNPEDEMIPLLERLLFNIQTGESEVMAWRSFSQAIDLDACYEFVEVLEQAYKSSGQITKVINRSCQILSDKIDLQLEIEVLISEKKLEFRIMMIAPLVLLALLSSSSQAYMTVLYTTMMGRIVMSFVLLSLLLAYGLGRKIIDIEL